MSNNKNNYQDDLLNVIKKEQDVIYGNKEDVPKNKPISNKNNDRDDDFDDIFTNNTKKDMYGQKSKQEYINKGGGKFSDSEEEVPKKTQPKLTIKKNDGVINDTFISSNRPKAEPIEEKKYTSFKGKSNNKNFGLSLNKKKYAKKQDDSKQKNFSIQKQPKFMYDDDMGEVAEWTGKSANTKAVKKNVSDSEDYDEDSYQDNNKNDDFEFDDVFDNDVKDKPQNDLKKIPQVNKANALASKYDPNLKKKDINDIGRITKSINNRQGLLTNKLAQMNEKITKKNQNLEKKDTAKFGEETPQAQIAKAKEQAAKNKEESEKDTVKFDFSNANKPQAKYENKKDLMEKAKVDPTKHFSIAKGNKLGSDDSADDDDIQNVESNEISHQFDFNNNVQADEDGWNEATKKNIAEIQKNKKELENLKAKQVRPMTVKEADDYFIEELTLEDQKKRIRTSTSNLGLFEKFFGCMNAKQNPLFYPKRDQLFALALQKYSDSNNEHNYQLTSIYKIITEKDYCALVGYHWKTIGFQSDLPERDIRDTGILGVLQVQYLLNSHKNWVKSYYELSIDKNSNFPMMISFFGFTKIVLEIFRDTKIVRKANGASNFARFFQIMFNAVFLNFYVTYKRKGGNFEHYGFILKEVTQNCESKPSQVIDAYQRHLSDDFDFILKSYLQSQS